MKKLKIGYFADGPWSHEAFNMIIKDNSLELAFIAPRINTKDNTLKIYSQKHKIDYLENSRVNSESFFYQVKKYNCDIFVSMSFNQIFKKKIINLPKFKTINCHAGSLPFYRGRNILNWVLINDEDFFGITVHYMDEGIDTGDIILQRKFPITDNDSYKTLLGFSYIECAKILYDSLKKIQHGDVKTIKQFSIDPIGSYCKRRVEGDEFINWNQSSRQVFNFIRAICKPGPSAHSKIDNKIVKINNSKIIKEQLFNDFKPGEVLSKNNTSYIVGCKNSLIEIKEVSSPIKVGQFFNSKSC